MIHDDPKNGEFAIIEMCRAVAAALVVFTHYCGNLPDARSWWLFAHTGVDFFFVISGYVFGPHLFFKKTDFGKFLVRRFFRIYPTFIVAMLIYLYVAYLQGRPLNFLIEHLTFNYLQSREMAFYYNAAFWSLPSEIGFYLIIPLLAWFIRKSTPKTIEVSNISSEKEDHINLLTMSSHLRFTMLFILAAATRIILAEFANFEMEGLYFSLLHHIPGILIEFLIGSYTWYLLNRKAEFYARFMQEQPLFCRAVPVCLFAAGIVLWFLLARHFGEVGDQGIIDTWLKGKVGVLASLAYALIISAAIVALRIRHISSIFRPDSILFKISVTAGALSYGVYLFHNAALYLTTTGGHSSFVALGITLIFSWFVYRLWELPLRQFGRRISV